MPGGGQQVRCFPCPACGGEAGAGDTTLRNWRCTDCGAKEESHRRTMRELTITQLAGYREESLLRRIKTLEERLKWCDENMIRKDHKFMRAVRRTHDTLSLAGPDEAWSCAHACVEELEEAAAEIGVVLEIAPLDADG